MKRIILTLMLSCIFIAPIYAKTAQPGIINFNLNPSPVTHTSVQPVTLYGCNNTVIKTKLFWNAQNQLLTNIPYGNYKSNTGKSYHIAKYYVLSPPVTRNSPEKQNPYVGLVIPDRFVFHGKKPAQIINIDFRVFKPTYLHYIPVDFNYIHNGKSCSGQHVNAILINIHCKDFPWINGAFGGSGIGIMTNSKTPSSFLPMLEKNKHPLQCTATIIDDILLNTKVFFALENGKKMGKTIDLTKLYKKSGAIKLICVPRAPTDIPAGCSGH
ncbi:MAG: hypothetical protein COY58_01945 [Gammaproteobacteria bacterium CG_4_10_14_0_8_um_filter_38_16]|nr:MAG: hypothetical protein COY58_01945 [Gammaproteobacteria bacterium CG_4_10_14_0_8_um_filter_38_16]PJA04077.1 MAG: hypothetical protein COX72_01730 [Gammaproteobacteria bacterium CG_4_10_14_0_2_um_filter_38_22]PJB10445.1 MAG: hypothetical protein CO120_04840 [Gammaproteobacteria bacterium CG_4_9_14_3_um_filter_38_9]